MSAEPLRTYLESSDAHDWLEQLAASDGMTTAVQPVIRLHDGATVGYEALARFPDGQRPDLAIEAAWRRGVGIELETLAIQRHLEAATDLEPEAWLALNVSGRVLTVLAPEVAGRR